MNRKVGIRKGRGWQWRGRFTVTRHLNELVLVGAAEVCDEEAGGRGVDRGRGPGFTRPFRTLKAAIRKRDEGEQSKKSYNSARMKAERTEFWPGALR